MRCIQLLGKREKKFSASKAERRGRGEGRRRRKRKKRNGDAEFLRESGGEL